MTPRDPKFVVADKPVNRRTAGRQPLPPVPVHPAAQERLRAAQARTRLGAPLAEQLRAPVPRDRTPLPPMAVLGGVVAACGAVAAMLAGLQSSPAGAAAGGIALLAGSALAWRHRRRPIAALQAAPVAPLLDDAAIHALDRAFEQMAPEVPASLVQPLAEFKQLVVRIARHPAAGAADEFFTLDDRMYVTECVRRYLPDTLQSYLAVPKAQRALPLADSPSPEGLLAAQLAMLRGELERREAKLARSAAEQLLRQQRFLKSKSG